ncbi:MAG TPA: S8 family serine peptidase [Bryobacteraceae bacterium]|nr:S8 family serine peptidase [Bryobacteraceae bacterium]
MKYTFLRCFGLALVLSGASWARIVPNRYIIELTDPPVADRMALHGGRGDQTEAIRHRADVRTGQLRTKAAVEEQGGEVLDSVDTVLNALMVRMPAGDAAKLANIPGVKSVHPVREFKLLLDHAVVVHKITDAWNLVGLDKAGAGIKIGMIDTGIDNAHPAFQDTSLKMPAGFPKTNASSDNTFTNAKVIVARSYAPKFFSDDPDQSAADDVGHGTATAMAAAGVLNAGPLATIRGVAPEAYLGSYKVFGSPGVNDTAPEDAILKAIDDAVADGMDVINMSLGDAVALPLPEDAEAMAIQRATNMGTIVVVAAGNAGPDPQTVGPPATAPAAITVGASANSRTFSAHAVVGGTRYLAIPGSGPVPANAVTAALKDVSKTGDDGLACSSLPPTSLKGNIALILRGTCFFTDKLNNVQAAGAIGALVYTDAARPDAIVMSVGSATLPAMMVSYQDGSAIKQRLAKGSLSATLDFSPQAASVDPDQLASFSAEGPNVDGSIKPDLVAVGENVYTAAETNDPAGDLYDPTGYLLVSGTSFSSPIVAGAAALLQAARPGLTAAQYRSLLVNTASPGFASPGIPARVQQAGTGTLDMLSAIQATSAASPASLSFGIGTGTVQQTKTLTISNVGTAAETFTIFATERDAPSGPVPPGSRTAELLATSGKQPSVNVATTSLTLNPGASADVIVNLTGSGIGPGAYEGYVHVVGGSSGVEERVPYWYAVGSGVPGHITILDTATDATAGSLTQDAALFRVTDANGITVPGASPKVTVIDGGGSVVGVVSDDSFFPGVFSLTVRLGPQAGNNDFQIQVGDLKQTVTIVGQ